MHFAPYEGGAWLKESFRTWHAPPYSLALLAERTLRGHLFKPRLGWRLWPLADLVRISELLSR